MKIDENSEYDTKYTYANTDNKNANISDNITIHEIRMKSKCIEETVIMKQINNPSSI
jgi:ribosomal protein S17